MPYSANALKNVDRISLMVDYGGVGGGNVLSARNKYKALGMQYHSAYDSVNHLNGASDIYYLTEDFYFEVLNTGQYIKANEIYEQTSKTVICQDEQIKEIAAAIAKNQRITTPVLKDNLLICGPTGVGKSEIFRCIGKQLDIPVISEDSTEYTASGFKGKDVTDILYNLYL